MKTVIVDIDGTIAKVGERLKYLKENPPNWDRFYEDCFEDELIEPVSMLVRAMDFAGLRVVYFTGRRESVRQKTKNWLEQNLLPRGKIYMRPDNDHRHDTEVKPEYLAQAGLNTGNVAFILEDRGSMVAKWRALGFTCLQVADGDF